MSAAAPGAARRAAFEVLRRVFEHDAWADRAFASAAERHGLDGRARARAQWLAYGAVQRRGTTDWVAARLTKRGLERLDAPVRAALRLGLFELLYAAELADHAVVDGAVELAKGGLRRRGPARARAGAGLVNAVLRRAVAERDVLLGELGDSDPESAAIAHSVPEWLAELWWREQGADSARALLRAANEPGETALRQLHLTEGRIRAASRPKSGPRRGGPLWPAETVVLPGGLTDEALGALERGSAIAQSRGAQAVVEVLDPQPGERVLDVCAGPGTKSVAIADRIGPEGSLVSVEIDAGRASQMRELFERTSVRNAEVRVADAAVAGLGEGYDRVLVDPPCSDLGTLASRPDARWRKSAELIGELAGLQRSILANAAGALAPEGRLVYSTCTVSRAEGEDLVGEVAGDAGLILDDLGAEVPALASPHHARCLQIRPDRDGTDGFFIARMRRP